jgi:type II secretory pathway pseudopilin PulG
MSYCAQCGTAVPAGAAACPQCGRPVPGAAAGAAGQAKSYRTLVIVLVGCAVVFIGVGVVGILAALIIPNFLDASQKAKQKRSVAEIQRIGQAIEAYKAEHGFAPAAAGAAGLARTLAGSTGAPIRALDGWKRPFRYDCWREQADARGCDHYRVASPGRDGVFERDDLRAYPAAPFDPTDYDRDIVFGDGSFIAWPQRSRSPSP